MRETGESILETSPDSDAAPAARRAPVRLLRPVPRPAVPRPRYHPLAPAGFPLIGRRHELHELETALDAALAGHTRVVLVGGEPGIGKTRLTSVVADDAAARGVPVWWGRGFEDGAAPAFWPWNTGLRRFIEQAGAGAIDAAAGPWGAELAHVFPVLCESLPELAPSPGSDSDGARFQLFEIVSRFLAAVARPAGLVVVLDDLHWADQASLKLLEFVAAALGDARLLVLATFRDTEVERDDACFATVSRIGREPSARRLALGGLTREECARWLGLTTLAGEAAALAPALHRETNGNPFFVGEIVQLLAGDDAAGATPQQIPHGARGVIARRLDRLGDEGRETLAVAALCGDPFDLGLVADVLGVEPAGHLARALRAGIVAPHEASAGRWGFAHALIRRVLLDELEPAARAAWHARIATVLERRAAVADGVTTELVRHFAAAGTAEGLRKAFDYACQGGEQAARGLGFEEAARLYEFALDVGGRAGLIDARRRIELTLALARALRGAGDVPAARARCSEVVEACRRTIDPNGLARDADALARAALVYAGPVPEFGRIEPAARAILEEAAKHGAALDDELRARLYARLAGDLIAANEIEQGARVFALCQDAAAAATRANAPGPLAVAHTGIYYAAAMGMRPAGDGPAIPTSREILAAAEAGREHEYAAAIRHARAATLFALNEPDEFARELAGLATAAAASHVPEALWLTDALAALRDTVQGRFPEARDAMERALATGRRMQLSNALGVHASQRITWHLFQGRLAEIRPEIERFVDEHPLGAGWRPVRALARLACGDTVAARAEFQSLLASGLSRAERGVMARIYLMGLGLLCIALRDREQAPLLYQRIVKRIDVWSIDGCQTLGPWAIALGGLARLCDRPADAAAHFETAIAVGRRMGSQPIVAHAQSLLASVRLSMSPGAAERARIGELLAEAAQSAATLGLVDVEARVARLAARRSEAPAPSKVLEDNAFHCDGEVWTVRFAGREVRLRDGKGPRYLAALLASPHHDRHVLDLAAGAPATGVAARAADGLTIGRGGATLDDAPDARARREYRATLADLRAELDEAEAHCDGGRAERLRAELELITAQLAQQFGAHARTRGPAETARKAVTKVLRTQIAKLLDVHPALGEHLRDAVRMGTFCSYAPRTSVEWEIAMGKAG